MGTVGPDVVVGVALGGGMDYTPLRWRNGVLEPFPYPPGAISVELEARTSDNGLVGGLWRLADGLPRPFIVDGDEFIDLAPLVPDHITGVIPHGINTAGVMAATAGVGGSTPNHLRACLVSMSGVFVVPMPKDWINFHGRAISNNGMVAGWARVPYAAVPTGYVDRPFRWSGGMPMELPLLEGDNMGRATGVNSLGMVVGQSWFKSPTGAESPKTAVIWIDDQPYRLNDISSAGGAFFSIHNAHRVDDWGVVLALGVAGSSSQALLLQPVRARAGDATFDCAVDARDLGVILDFWGTSCDPPYGPGDVNGDGIVDAFDLAEVLGDWDPPRVK
jgi:hypothetical protein